MKKTLLVIALLWSSQVWAQCPPHGGIAVNPTNYVLLMPSDVPGVTATLYGLANVNGALPSHTLTIAPGNGIWIGATWASTHGATANSWITVDNDPTHRSPSTSNLGGTTTQAWYFDGTSVGHVYGFHYEVVNGSNNSQDAVTITSVAGAGPSLIEQDEIPTNLYYEATASFSGTSNMACGACQQNPQACSNVTHQPSISFSLSNLTSGEVQNQPTIYGQPVNPTFNNGMASNPLYISVLPGDTTQDSQTDQVDCSLMGIFYNQGPTNSGTGKTFKTMKTKIRVVQQGSTTAGVTRWYVDSWCKDTQHTPIWEPIYIDTKGAISSLISVGQYELSYGDCWAEPGWPAWECAPMTVTPPQPLHIGVGGTKYDCSTLINTPLPQ